MKVRWPLFIFVAVIFLLCKLFVFQELNIELEGCRPDLLIVLGIYVALFAELPESMVAGWFLGTLQDISSCERYGFFSFLFCITNMMVVKFRKGLATEHFFMAVVVIFALSLQCNALHSAWISESYDVDLFGRAFLGSLYTALFSPFLLLFFKKISLVREECKRS